MKSKPTPVRGSLLVNPRFQLRLVAIANLLALVAFALVGAVTWVFVQKLESKAAQFGIDPGHPFMEYLRLRQRGLFATYGFVGFGACVLVSIGTLVMSHRIAGPIYRLRKHLDEVSAGKSPKPLRFRPRDYFQELAASYSRAHCPSEKARDPKDGAA